MSLLARLLLGLMLTLALAGSAFAHAAMIAANPAHNTVLTAAPTQFTLEFSEPVSPLVLNLILPDGKVTPLEGATLVANTLTIPAPSALGSGSFLLSYRVVSEDGHPVGGTVRFSIGTANASADPTTAATDGPLLLAIWLAKLLLYTGLFIGVAGTAFRHWLAQGADAGKRAGTIALLLGLVAVPVSLGLQGLDALGLPMSALLRPDVWTTGAATSLGPSAALAFTAMALALLADRLTGATARLLALLAFAGIGLALIATGHASSANPHWLTRSAVFLHATGIAFWVGALLPLWSLLKADAPAAEPALRRFSALIPFALIVLLAAGITLAVIQLGSPAALLQTAYGRVLLAKLALVAIVLGLAAINRWRLTRPAAQANPNARRQLVRIILAETLLLLAVFGVVALWRFTPPPRASVAPLLSIMLHAEATMVTIAFATPDRDASAADLTIATLRPPRSVTMSLGNPGAGVEPVSYTATQTGPGLWHIPALLIPTPGTWTIQLGLRVSDLDLVTLAGQASFPPAAP